MRDDRQRLRDIRDPIRQIERYAKRGRREFEEDELIHTWMIHHIQIIGEAASKLSPSFRKDHHEIPWPQIIKMRHVLVHDYFGIDLGEVWTAVERDLPVLKKQVSALIRKLPTQPRRG
ncbi:MAG: HepT-like ribonuclease domain-containing protein [Nitrospira sp.]